MQEKLDAIKEIYKVLKVSYPVDEDTVLFHALSELWDIASENGVDIYGIKRDAWQEGYSEGKWDSSAC